MTIRGITGAAIIATGLLLAAACSGPGSDPAAETREHAPLPPREADAPRLDERAALGLASLPLACLDRPQPRRRGSGYLYERELVLRPDFEARRAFYGCYDWHSAVNSTWTLVRLLERFPELEVAPLIVEKLREHLSETALQGEQEFFAAEGNESFERPYGWAWFLALDAALRDLDNEEAGVWAQRTSPLALRFADGLVDYLGKLDYPFRVGTHANTAFTLDLALGWARATDHEQLRAAVDRAARRLFARDRSCPLAYEPSGGDFLSPCLEEAKLMAAVLPAEELEPWLDGFLPPPDSGAFRSLDVPVVVADREEELDISQQGAKSHLIGLSFTRAEALLRIAAALPAGDPRRGVYARVADAHGRRGFAAMFDAEYLGSHWLATFAVRYLLAAQ